MVKVKATTAVLFIYWSSSHRNGIGDGTFCLGDSYRSNKIRGREPSHCNPLIHSPMYDVDSLLKYSMEHISGLQPGHRPDTGAPSLHISNTPFTSPGNSTPPNTVTEMGTSNA